MAFINLIMIKLKSYGLIFVIPFLVYMIISKNQSNELPVLLSDSEAFEAVLNNSLMSNDDISSFELLNITLYHTKFPATNYFPFFNDVRVLDDSLNNKCNRTPPGLEGRIDVDLNELSIQALNTMFSNISHGGHSTPKNCLSRHKVAIIIAYKERESHLHILLNNLHSLLTKQQLDYAIFLVEPIANQTFNRGKLMNVGYDVASKLYPWQCFIFHDVDLLPEDDRNLYTCPTQPRHMSVAIDKFNYKLVYPTSFGGISAITKQQFEKVNGFSNDYWGWGGEDDDLWTRLSESGYEVYRYPAQIARYKMIKHSEDNINPRNECRFTILDQTKKRSKRDGLSSLNYEIVNIKFEKLYTKIQVDLLEEQSKIPLRQEFPKCYDK